MPFTALALAACLLMCRIVGAVHDERPTTLLVVALGILLGLAALTRNEAIWLALTWAGIAWFSPITGTLPTAARLRLIGIAAVAAIVVFAPWAIRDWQVFGSPLPGQAAVNALSLRPTDIFAWNEPATLDRYLAAGPVHLLEQRVTGIGHNLFNVLLLPGMPFAALGLLGLPLVMRTRAALPVTIVAVVTFLFSGLVFPVATTWGTFLHSAGPAHVLVVIGGLMLLDAGIARLAAARGWTRPVAWLGPTLGIAGSVLLSVVLLGAFASGSRATEARFDALATRMADLGRPLDATAGPVISNVSIWIAETRRISALALPDESPVDVLDLAASFDGARYVVLVDPDFDHWPADIDEAVSGAECFAEIDLGATSPPSSPDPLDKIRVFEIVCR
jgi:hypothetical protein